MKSEDAIDQVIKQRMIDQIRVLFLESWYVASYPDVGSQSLEPFLHFIKFGMREGRAPSPLFIPSYYCQANDLQQLGVANALQHYLLYGWKEGRLVHPLFDSNYYENNGEFSTADNTPHLVHYIKVGAALDRSPHPLVDITYYKKNAPIAELEHMDALSHYLFIGHKQQKSLHLLFDAQHYRHSYPDVEAANIDPLTHYVEHGWKERRNPHPLFDTRWYLSSYSDVATAQVEPLSHYSRVGYREGRWPHPLFNTSWYRMHYGAHLRENEDPLSHYIELGSHRGYKPNYLFFPSWYRSVYGVTTEPLVDYVCRGEQAGFNPSPYFDTKWYGTTYSDITGGKLQHFLHSGSMELRKPNRFFDSIWYEKHYSVVKHHLSPVEHFIQVGEQEGRKPNQAFDSRWYSRRYGDDLRRTGCQPFEHYVSIGCFEGNFENEISLLVAMSPLVDEEVELTIGGDAAALAASTISETYLCSEPYIIFVSEFDPFRSEARDGYSQRVRVVDRFFQDCKRVYLCPNGPMSLDGNFLNILSKNAIALDMSGNATEAEIARILCSKASAVYAHSILPLAFSTIVDVWAAAPLKILDLHGVVPEETALSGQIELAATLDLIERQILNTASVVICVTEKMRNWLELKHGSIGAELLVAPIITEVAGPPAVSDRPGVEPTTIYSGGCQAWQCAELMLNVAKLTGLPLKIVTNERAAFDALLVESFVDREKVRLDTAESMSQMWRQYVKADFGYVLRTNSIVNSVACPTKLIEYCLSGVVPILNFEDIGDFREYGLKWLSLRDLCQNDLPSQDDLRSMRYSNFALALKLRSNFYSAFDVLATRIFCDDS